MNERLSPHRCHAKGCKRIIPPRLLMCRGHWWMVPRGLRDAIWAAYREGQEIRKDPSREWLIAARQAIDAVAVKEAVTE